MNFQRLSIAGSYLVEPEPHADDRGFFVRTYCSKVFADKGLNPNLRQCSISFSVSRHTLRGMHYQLSPHEEAKLVRCTQGAAYHVVLDLRDESENYLQWAGAELSAANRNMIYVPEGVAHGFITLQDDTEIFYQISECYSPESAAGVRWDDPVFDIAWPSKPAVISERDRGFADYCARR